MDIYSCAGPQSTQDAWRNHKQAQLAPAIPDQPESTLQPEEPAMPDEFKTMYVAIQALVQSFSPFEQLQHIKVLRYRDVDAIRRHP